jgi:hypothetical protein
MYNVFLQHALASPKRTKMKKKSVPPFVQLNLAGRQLTHSKYHLLFSLTPIPVVQRVESKEWVKYASTAVRIDISTSAEEGSVNNRLNVETFRK